MKVRKEQLKKLLRPTSIAVIGATDVSGKVGAVITNNLLSGGFIGHVVCVNPRRDKAYNHKCFDSLADADEEMDCAIVVVPAQFVYEVIRASVPYCKNFVVVAAGFGETDVEGKKREEQLLQLAQEHHLAIVGPNCLGFIVPSLKLNASFAGGVVHDGGIALVSQSGALAVAAMDRAAGESQGFSLIVSLGNKMQIDEIELLQFLAEDANTHAIGLYLEHIADGKAFANIAQKIVAHKPIILLKSGRTKSAQKATQLHTGALTQQDDVIDALCKKVGIIRADSFEEFYYLLQFAQIYGTVALTKHVAIITNAGGFGVLATDACEIASVELAQLSPLTQEALRDVLPHAASVINPIDLLGDAGVDRYQMALRAIAEDPEVGIAMVILTPQEQTPIMDIAREIVKYYRTLPIPMIVSFVGGLKVHDAIAYLRRNNVVVVDTPAMSAKIIAQIQSAYSNQYPVAQNKKHGTKVGDKIIALVREQNRKALYFHEAQEICAQFNIPTVTTWKMNYHSPREVKFPAVAKVDAPNILHKTDKKGVILNIQNPEELVQAVDILYSRFSGQRVIVQQMLVAGIEIILGVTRDKTAGPMVMVGYGGIYAEQINMTVLLQPPFTVQQAEKILTQSRLGFLFRTTRGQSPYHVQELAQIATALGDVVLTYSWIEAIDINPLFLYNDSSNHATAVDVKMIVGDIS